MFAVFSVFGLFSVSVFLLVFGEFLGWFGSVVFTSFGFFVIFGSLVLFWFEYGLFDFFSSSFGSCFFDLTAVVPVFSNSFSLEVDTGGFVFLFCLVLISYFVHTFSFFYMFADSSRLFFLCVLSFFTFSMSGLIIASNLHYMFMFFELVAWCSFVLISWFMSYDSFNSAGKALILSSFSDFFFIALFSDSLSRYSSCYDAFVNAFCCYDFMFYVVCFVFLLAKSAIFPFHSWLIWAMAGPTPVSSLLHSATLVVTSYVILFKLFSFYISPFFSSFFVGYLGLNIVFGSLFSVFSYDIKKLIAYSTMSQISLVIMFFLIYPDASYIYFFSHGLVNSSLFMSVGYIMHGFVGQDISSYFGCYGSLGSFFYFGVFISCLSLSSFPFTTFFSLKEMLFDLMFLWVDLYGFVFLCIINYCVFLTSIYSLFIVICFFDVPYTFSILKVDPNYFVCYFMVLWLSLFFCSISSELPGSNTILISLVFGLMLSTLSLSFYSSVGFSWFNYMSYSSFASGFSWDSFLNCLAFYLFSFGCSVSNLLEYFIFESAFYFLSYFFSGFSFIEFNFFSFQIYMFLFIIISSSFLLFI